MAQTEAQKRAQKRYVQSKVKDVGLRFYPSEADILALVQAQPNKQGFIKQVLREYLESHPLEQTDTQQEQ